MERQPKNYRKRGAEEDFGGEEPYGMRYRRGGRGGRWARRGMRGFGPAPMPRDAPGFMFGRGPEPEPEPEPEVEPAPWEIRGYGGFEFAPRRGRGMRGVHRGFGRARRFFKMARLGGCMKGLSAMYPTEKGLDIMFAVPPEAVGEVKISVKERELMLSLDKSFDKPEGTEDGFLASVAIKKRYVLPDWINPKSAVARYEEGALVISLESLEDVKEEKTEVKISFV